MASPVLRRYLLLLRDFGECGGLGKYTVLQPVNSMKRWMSTEPSPSSPPVRPTAPRTTRSPGQQTKDHRGLWYTLEPNTVNRLFSQGGISRHYLSHCKIFAETCLMVRQPALTLMDYIQRSDLSLPPNKFLLYGVNGSGKTLSLAHTLHFLAESSWLLVHIPWAVRWNTDFKEVTPSSTVEGNYNHPIEAAVWLQHFKTQNAELLKSLKLETEEKYIWSRREVTEANSPLTELVDLGIARTRYSTDCVMALLSELKKLAIKGRCKVAVVADGINAFYLPASRYCTEDKSLLEPRFFTLFQAFKQLFRTDWKNAVIVGSIDLKANEGTRRDSYLPRYVLRQEGWEELDPFVPIKVEDYDELEMHSAIDYYLDRHWLQNPQAGSDIGRREIAALSAHNPHNLMRVCRPL